MFKKRPEDTNQMVENEAEAKAEQHVPKTGFMLRVEEMSEREWNKWSMVAGVVLGIAAAACLFLYPPSDSPLPMGALIALGLAMVLPNYAERRLERRAPKLRIALIITLVVAMVVYLGVMLLTNGGTL